MLEWVATPPLGDLPLGIKPVSLISPALASRFFTASSCLVILKSVVPNQRVLASPENLLEIKLPGSYRIPTKSTVLGVGSSCLHFLPALQVLLPSHV